ncbi:Farnesylcysteine lyase [Sphaceloma murrayae]|uniref:Farnesylcysteine lyase n=1 Tax=Sphaceloma murrayae TaxID=2082308 RepID=A0A2K1R3P2_9PEZI|nr:Farnesylcysteine lyase [Sphaceloma murrayae]
MLLSILLSLLPLVTSQSAPQIPLVSDLPPKRVAIIGAGSAGSSTAYFLQKYASAASIPLNITIYDRNTTVGGRSTTIHPFNDPSLPALELGASIFVSVNHNLVNATRDLGLSASSSNALLSASAGSGTPDLGIWDGQRMVLVQQSSDGWWDLAKLVWRYGLAPYKTLRLMKRTVAKFLRMYEGPVFPFGDLGGAVEDVGLVDVVAANGRGYLERWEIRGLFGREVVQAATRVNYAIGIEEVSGLIAMVCMAAEGAMSVDGGNWRIFEGMVERSGATRGFGVEVKGVRNEKGEGMEDRLEVTTRPVGGGRGDEVTEKFDEVVLAAPHQFADVVFEDVLQHVPEEIPYVKLHVTILTSRHRLDPEVFGLEKGEKAPRAILTTTPEEQGVAGPGFNSISLLREVLNPETKTPEFAYKIFTMEPVNSTFLGRIFGLGNLAADANISEDDISWIYRKRWSSYPYEYPRATFEEIKLADHVWYTSGIESFISTMETSSLMGMNVARLMVDEWLLSVADAENETDVADPNDEDDTLVED